MTRQFGPMLNRAAEVLFEQIAEHPHIAPRLAPVAVLLRAIAADVDVYAVARLKEADRIKKILNKIVDIAPGQEPDRLRAVIGLKPASPDDYGSDALDRYLGRHKEALIEVHAWLETAEVLARDDLLEEILAYLDEQAKHESRLVSPMW